MACACCVTTRVGASGTVRWTGSRVGASATARWTNSRVGADAALSWAKTRVGADASLGWAKTRVGSSATASWAKWRVGSSAVASWDVTGGTYTQPAGTVKVGNSATAAWTRKPRVATEGSLYWNAAPRPGSPAAATWVASRTGADLAASWTSSALQGRTGASATANWSGSRVGQSGRAAWPTRGRVGRSRCTRWAVRSRAGSSRTANWRSSALASSACLPCQCPAPCLCWGKAGGGGATFTEVQVTFAGLPVLAEYDPNGTYVCAFTDVPDLTAAGGTGWAVSGPDPVRVSGGVVGPYPDCSGGTHTVDADASLQVGDVRPAYILAALSCGTTPRQLPYLSTFPAVDVSPVPTPAAPTLSVGGRYFRQQNDRSSFSPVSGPGGLRSCCATVRTVQDQRVNFRGWVVDPASADGQRLTLVGRWRMNTVQATVNECTNEQVPSPTVTEGDFTATVRPFCGGYGTGVETFAMVMPAAFDDHWEVA